MILLYPVGMLEVLMVVTEELQQWVKKVLSEVRGIWSGAPWTQPG